jgi:hypothetical protein
MTLTSTPTGERGAAARREGAFATGGGAVLMPGPLFCFVWIITCEVHRGGRMRMTTPPEARPRARGDRGAGAPPHQEGKIHRVDPDFGSTLTATNRDSLSNFWVNWKIMGQPCEFQVKDVLDV